MQTNPKWGIPQYIKTQIKTDPIATVTKQELYDDYYEYCLRNLTPPAFKNMLSRILINQIPGLITTRRTINGTRTWCWQGITHKTNT